MRLQVIIEPRAERDIDEAAGWIAVHAPAAAEHWFDAMQSAIQSLADFPVRCPRARECSSARYELRQLVFGRRHGRYRLIFTIHDGRVHLLHVRHGAKASMTEAEAADLLPPWG